MESFCTIAEISLTLLCSVGQLLLEIFDQSFAFLGVLLRDKQLTIKSVVFLFDFIELVGGVIKTVLDKVTFLLLLEDFFLKLLDINKVLLLNRLELLFVLVPLLFELQLI